LLFLSFCVELGILIVTESVCLESMPVERGDRGDEWYVLARRNEGLFRNAGT
jgi:hypothetical protein